MKKLLSILILSLLFGENVYAEKKNYYEQYLSECSNSPIKTFFITDRFSYSSKLVGEIGNQKIEKELIEGKGTLVYSGKNLDKNCFKQKFTEHHKLKILTDKLENKLNKYYNLSKKSLGIMPTKIHNKNFKIHFIREGSSAYKSNLRVGDTIIAYNGIALISNRKECTDNIDDIYNCFYEFEKIFEQFNVGDKINLQVIRNNKSKNIILEIFPIKDRVVAELGWSENFNNSIPKIKSLDNIVCVEGCKLIDDYIYFYKNNYLYFYNNTHSYGYDINILERNNNQIIKSNKWDLNNPHSILISQSTGTYTDNTLVKFDKIINASNNDIVSGLSLMDGKLEFYNNYYVAKGKKSYLSTDGGAFWFNAIFNYKNQYIELLNTGSDCYEVDEFIKGYDKDLKKTKKEIKKNLSENDNPTWWLAALSKHHKNEWCIN